MRYDTHMLFGAALSQILASVIGNPLELFVGSVIGTLLPDVDHPNSYIGRRVPFIPEIIYSKWGHRTVTHSLRAVLFVAVVTLPLLFLKQQYFNSVGVWLGLILGYGSHLLSDAFTPSGIRFMYPSPRKFSLGKIYTNSSKEKLFAFPSLVVLVLFLMWKFYGMLDSLIDSGF